MAKSSTKTASKTKVAEAPKVAKAVATKATKPSKKSKKEPTPSSSSESESDSEASESGSGSDSDSSEEEAPAKKTNSKAAPAKKAAATEDSSDSESSSDEAEVVAPVVKSAKNAAQKVVEAGKGAVNGVAKKVAKATDNSDSSDSDSSDDAEAEKSNTAESDDSSDSDDSSEEEAAPSKKRKAEDEAPAAAKKSKTETETDGAADTGVKNLFVGNLSWNIDDEWLYREFEEFGEITGARVISDRDSGRSKGFGYVEFANSADAATALKAKKGAMIDGREANVDFSTPRDTTAPKERANQRAQQFGDSKNPESDTIFVGNLSFEADENMVGEAFGAHGTVTNIRLPTDMDTGAPKGFGYVSFGSVEEAKAAFENMTGAEIGGRPVRLDYATPRPERGDTSRPSRGRGAPRGGRGSFGGDRGRGSFGGGRGSARGGRGGRGGSTNRGGFGDFKGAKKTFE